jgi:hypothetical protein
VQKEGDVRLGWHELKSEERKCRPSLVRWAVVLRLGFGGKLGVNGSGSGSMVAIGSGGNGVS